MGDFLGELPSNDYRLTTNHLSASDNFLVQSSEPVAQLEFLTEIYGNNSQQVLCKFLRLLTSKGCYVI